MNLALGFYMAPLMPRMHPMGAELPHEELQLSAATFCSFFFETISMVPSYQRWYGSQDHTDAYRYLRQLLQALQWTRGGQRWVLKSPQHLDQFGPLISAFPDAKIIRTHRDPVRAALSLATMITYSRRAFHHGFDHVAEARSWVDRVEQMLRRSVEQEHLLPLGQVLELRFHDFVGNPWGTLERVFEFADQPLDGPARHAIRAHIEANPCYKQGAIDYNFSDLGLDPPELRERMRFYQERFDLPDEPS